MARIEVALSVDPKDTEALFERALIFTASKAFAKAEADYDAVIALRS